ncbi:MAG: hypothetical protein V1928_00175 [Parcubacteria group bacterium]
MPITPAAKINQNKMSEKIKINGSAETIETPEQESLVEQTVENAPEHPSTGSGLETEGSASAEVAPVAIPSVQTAVPAAPAVKSEELKEIENILSEDLGELYKTLPDNRKAEFKKQGEEAATKIQALLSSVKINFNKIVGLITSWLKMIPGINKFFLEQEAKLKADELIALKEKTDIK